METTTINRRRDHRRTTWQVLALLFALSSSSASAIEKFELRGHEFTVPDGFEVTIAAEPPLVVRPIMADFDFKGRMFVAESSGSNDKVQVQLEKKPHWISRLEDTDGDGVFDRKTIFADKLMFPEGVLWHDGSVYVAAPPSIWKLTDTDDDGVADEREEWFEGKTLTGCANDLHGPYLGPDGWIYWCKGAFAEQRYPRAGKPDFVTRAAHIFRRRPEGGEIEPVMTGGMDNPVELAFSRSGERFFTTTFLQHPAGGRRDGIIHAIYGGVYGKNHSVIDGHPRTGELMPVMTHLGPAAACGLMRYASSGFGPGFRDNLFATSFNLRRITRHQLEPDGATFKTRDSDFLVSSNHDFHPTDVLEDADGSLLVIDTGGWYKLCCPSSQLYKPDIPGAIYRIRKKGGHKDQDAWKERRLMADAAAKGDSIIPDLKTALEESSSDEERLRAVWTLARLPSEAARAVGRLGLSDKDETVRHAAVHSVALWRDSKALSQLKDLLLADQSSPIKRAAAEALGRIGDPSATGALLAASGMTTDDRVLEHSLIFAMIEIGDEKRIAPGIASSNANIARAALTALDQLHGNHLKPDDIRPFLRTDDSLLRDRIQWIFKNHANWGAHFADHLSERLHAVQARNDDPNLASLLAQLSGNEAVQALLSESLTRKSSSAAARAVALDAMSRSKVKSAPNSWSTALVQTLNDTTDSALQRKAVSTARALKSNAVDPALTKIAASSNLPVIVRIEALEALAKPGQPMSDDLFTFVAGSISASKPLPVRSAAAQVLAKAPLSSGQLTHIAKRLPDTAPMEFNRLLPVFAASQDPAAGAALVDALGKVKFLGSVPPAALENSVAKFPAEIREKAHAQFAAVHQNIGERKDRLTQLLAKLPAGDVRRGQRIFNSEGTACKSCHAIGYTGGRLGPDLTRIGGIRSKRDLLEAILYPSASFVRSYEPVVVRTKDGKTIAGQLKNESGSEIELALDPLNTTTISRDEIASLEPGSVSLMPPGIDQLLTTEQLADLITFLQANR